MTPHQIDLVRQVQHAVEAAGLDPGPGVLRRHRARHPDLDATVELELCASLTRLVADLDRVARLHDDTAALAAVLEPLRPSPAALSDLGVALDEVLREELAADDYTAEHAEACHLAWRLVTELLQQRPAGARRRLRI